MKPFVFRAEAALDIRRKEDDAAQRALALAETELRTAAQAVEAADRAIGDAQARARAAAEDLREAHLLQWHRNWMVGLQREVARARQRQEQRRIEVKAAAARAQQARRALRALERLRERAWQAYQQLARREDQKALDLLGSLQFAVRHISREENAR